MNLGYFVGKVCTVATVQTNLLIKNEKEFVLYYNGIVEQVDEHGIWLKSLINSKMSFFSNNYIVGVFEEETLEETDPSFKEIKDKISKQKIPLKTI